MHERRVSAGIIRLLRGDITRQTADAIVTAANSGLRGGGGVDGAVHRAAGSKLLEACRKIGGCRTGSAVLTPSFDLEARGVKCVIHAVGPIWSGGGNHEPEHLASAYSTALDLADEAGCRSIAFPSISTGVYGFPVEKAAPIAVSAARSFLEHKPRTLSEIYFVLFDDDTFDAFERALSE